MFTNTYTCSPCTYLSCTYSPWIYSPCMCSSCTCSTILNTCSPCTFKFNIVSRAHTALCELQASLQTEYFCTLTLTLNYIAGRKLWGGILKRRSWFGRIFVLWLLVQKVHVCRLRTDKQWSHLISLSAQNSSKRNHHLQKVKTGSTPSLMCTDQGGRNLAQFCNRLKMAPQPVSASHTSITQVSPWSQQGRRIAVRF